MVGIVETDVEGTLPPSVKGGMVMTTVDGMGPPLVGSEPIAVCAVTTGPLGRGPIGLVEGILVRIGGMDMSPLLTIPP